METGTYFLNGTRLLFQAPNNNNTFEVCGTQRVEIGRNSGANSPTGIYRCDIRQIPLFGANLFCANL